MNNFVIICCLVLFSVIYHISCAPVTQAIKVAKEEVEDKYDDDVSSLSTTITDHFSIIRVLRCTGWYIAAVLNLWYVYPRGTPAVSKDMQ